MRDYRSIISYTYASSQPMAKGQLSFKGTEIGERSEGRIIVRRYGYDFDPQESLKSHAPKEIIEFVNSMPIAHNVIDAEEGEDMEGGDLIDRYTGILPDGENALKEIISKIKEKFGTSDETYEQSNSDWIEIVFKYPKSMIEEGRYAGLIGYSVFWPQYKEGYSTFEPGEPMGTVIEAKGPILKLDSGKVLDMAHALGGLYTKINDEAKTIIIG